MALIVETGAIVANADSYVSRADFISYAAGRGITIPNTDATDAQLVKAAEYIGSYEGRLRGLLVSREQPMAYPRSDLVIEGWDWADNEIPRQVKLCQMQFALDINAGVDPYNPPSSDSTGIKRERVEGAVEVEYAIKEAVKLSRNSTSRALLSSLLMNSGLSLVLERS